MKSEQSTRKLLPRLGAIRFRQSVLMKPLAIALVIALLPALSWLEGGAMIAPNHGGRLFQASAQIVVGACDPNPANAIIQNHCPNGIIYSRADLDKLESDSVAAYLALHNLPSSDAARIYQYGRSDLRNEIRGAMLAQLLTIAQKPEGKRSPHEAKLYQWLQAIVQHNEIANYTAAYNEFQRWQADPCHFKLDAEIAKQYGLSYQGAPFCNPLSQLFSGPLAPAESYFIAYGLAKSYGKPAEKYPDFASLVTGTQLAVSEQLGIALGSGALLGAGAAATVAAFSSSLFPFALGYNVPELYVAGEWVAGASSDLTVGSVATGPAAIVFIGVAIGVTAALQVFDNQKTIDDLNDLGRRLNEAQATPPDLNAFANDASGVGIYKLNESLVAQTLPGVPSTAALPSWRPGLTQFSIAPSGAAPAAATTVSYQDWTGLNWTAQNWSSSPNNTGWFVQTCTSGSACGTATTRFNASIQYVDWNGVKWTASRFGENFVHTRAVPDSQDQPCPVDAATGLTPDAAIDHCLSYTSQHLRLKDSSGADVEVTLSRQAAFTTPSVFYFTAGQESSAEIAAVGAPTPAVTQVSGPPNAGVFFTTTNEGHARIICLKFAQPGNYSFVVAASNGSAAPVQQRITAVVSNALQFTSPASLHVTFGVPVKFKVTTTGIAPVTLTDTSGALLFNGLTFTDNQDGTATIEGTPKSLLGNNVPLCVLLGSPCTITASNPTGSVTQNFQLTGTLPPAAQLVTRSAVFVAGQYNSTLISTAGATTPVRFEPGNFPPWLTLTDNHNGTAWLRGIPPVQPSGALPIIIDPLALGADFNINLDPDFTLNIDAMPTFTSAGKATFTEGHDKIVEIFATGSAISANGATLPSILKQHNAVLRSFPSKRPTEWAQLTTR